MHLRLAKPVAASLHRPPINLLELPKRALDLLNSASTVSRILAEQAALWGFPYDSA